jgi:hypothetical protein
MSHPNLDPAPPAAATLGRLNWFAESIRKDPDRHDSKSLAALRGAAMELYTAADRELMARARL